MIIDPGVNIKFSNGSYIFIEDGFIEINGSESDHVYLSAKDNYWSGLHLSNCIKPSKIKYTNLVILIILNIAVFSLQVLIFIIVKLIYRILNLETLFLRILLILLTQILQLRI